MPYQTGVKQCDAMICCMSAPEIMRLTRMGKFRMDKEATGAMALLKRLRGGSDKTGRSAGAQQMTMLRRLPRLLRFIPGTAQDVRAYFLTLQYWLAGSETNLARMMAFLVNRYAGDEHAAIRDSLQYEPPVDYPDTGLYHQSLPDRITDDPKLLGKALAKQRHWHGWRVAHALLCAVGKQRPLRCGDSGAGRSGPSRHSCLRVRPRCAAGR